uniref:Uncharacterized protein n=1 Tax=Arundo donax TaxID=35708 RepID=A0A0A8Y1F8_ARUDO
MHKGLGERKYQ